ncbi:hypothetical protein SAMN05421505_13837 [Sinosporangium album]|uniref:DUF1648 domain-containing protein n=2 Tax=Sinosporangium album TaxID=504805 RepID=A0A1G8IPZ1_9ACTN|nr:hypothetical protein SAMN05421505_13837 [Sinosporangium album]
MTPRNRALAIGGAWGVVVTAAVLTVPLSQRGRLPEPLATHWGPGGVDGTASFTATLLVSALLWVIPWALLMGIAVVGPPTTRQGRATWWAALGGWGVLAAGITLLIVYSNLDVAQARDAAMSWWQPVAVVGGGFAAAALAGFLGRGEPDPPQEAASSTGLPTVRLRPGRRTVWIGRTSNRWLAAMSWAAVAPAAILGGGAAAGLLPAHLGWVGLSLAPLAVIGSITSTVRVRIGDDGLTIGFGAFGWPRRHIPLDRVDSAWAEARSPADVGGWGLRGLPGASTIMLRGGQCLVARYTSGGRIAISVDDAERGAALLNALVMERSEALP